MNLKLRKGVYFGILHIRFLQSEILLYTRLSGIHVTHQNV